MSEPKATFDTRDGITTCLEMHLAGTAEKSLMSVHSKTQAIVHDGVKVIRKEDQGHMRDVYVFADVFNDKIVFMAIVEEIQCIELR